VPDDVDTLNYLGYTWVDRGENLKEAFDMIRQAVEQEPESGAIVDSLGWGHYKLGEYEEAFDPTDKERDVIDIKLVGGLDAVPAELLALP